MSDSLKQNQMTSVQKRYKKLYRSPKLVEYGTVRAMTGNMTNQPFADAMGMTMVNP